MSHHDYLQVHSQWEKADTKRALLKKHRHLKFKLVTWTQVLLKLSDIEIIFILKHYVC